MCRTRRMCCKSSCGSIPAPYEPQSMQAIPHASCPNRPRAAAQHRGRVWGKGTRSCAFISGDRFYGQLSAARKRNSVRAMTRKTTSNSKPKPQPRAVVACPGCGKRHNVPMPFPGWFDCTSCDRRYSGGTSRRAHSRFRPGQSVSGQNSQFLNYAHSSVWTRTLPSDWVLPLSYLSLATTCTRDSP